MHLSSTPHLNTVPQLIITNVRPQLQQQQHSPQVYVQVQDSSVTVTQPTQSAQMLMYPFQSTQPVHRVIFATISA